MVRESVLRVHYDGDWWRHLALTLLRIGGESDVAGRLLKRAQPDGGILIPYSGPPAHTRTVSYLSVLRGDLPANALRGKYVLVGAWATGLSDTYPTPVSHDTSGMSGVEIVANVLQAARDDIAYQAPPPWLNALFSALPALLACLALWRLSPKRALLVCLALLAAVLAASLLLLSQANLWFAPSAALLGVALSYPMWSWRSQEAALRYMDYELRRLQREYPPVLNEARAQSFGHSASLEHRVGELSRALARVRNLRRFLADGLDGMPDATLVFDEQGRMQFRNQAAVMYFQRLGMRPPRVGHPATHLLERTISDDDARQRLAGRTERTGTRILALERRPGSARSRGTRPDPQVRAHPYGGRPICRHGGHAHRHLQHPPGRAPARGNAAFRVARHARAAKLDPGVDRHASRSGRARQPGRYPAAYRHAGAPHAEPGGRFRAPDPCGIDGYPPGRAGPGQPAAGWRGRVLGCRPEKNIALATQPDLPVAYALGDQTLLMRALCNLIDNAIKYSPADTRIDCGIEEDDGYWRISVRDQGRGIAAQDLDSLFEPFSRVAADTRKDVGGAGLGLAFVRTVAQRHGGTAEVSSEPGRGSVFSLRLPMAPEHDGQ